MPEHRKPIGPIGKTQQEMIEEMYLRLVGDGTDEKPGLIVEVDRIKQFVKTAKWVIGGVVSVVIGTVTTWFIAAWKAGK